MPNRLHQTPDGRVICYTAPNGTRDSDEVAAPALAALKPFIQACMAMLPDLPMSGRTRATVLLFLLGAADRMWQRFRLDDQLFPDFAADLLRQQGLPAAEAVTLAGALPQARDDASAREALLEGAEAMDHWLDDHDGNSVLRLGELLSGWRRE
jgi:hypothetical protein